MKLGSVPIKDFNDPLPSKVCHKTYIVSRDEKCSERAKIDNLFSNRYTDMQNKNKIYFNFC